MTYTENGGPSIPLAADTTSAPLLGSSTIVVTYTDAVDGARTFTFDVAANGRGFGASALAVGITVTTVAAANADPVITSDGGGATAAISVAENQTAVTDVQTTDDNDSEGSGLTYSLTGGADQGSFGINGTTGVLTFNAAPDFANPTDTGANNTYEVVVTVTDSGGLTDVQTITVTVTIDGELRRIRTQRVISNFMGRRADQITANDPDLVNRLNGGNSGGSGGPVGFAANGTLQNNQLAFSTSLRQIIGSSEAAKTKRRKELGQMMSLGQQSVIGATLDQGSGLDIWVQGKWSQVDQATRDSNIGLLYIGADYRISPGLLVGVLGQIDWTDEEDTSQNLKADGRGWMIGPYLAARLHQNLLFDGRVAWGQSDNDVSPFGTYTDSFDTDRWLVRGQLTGDFKYARWHFAPSVRVIYFEEDQKAYRDSLGVFIPGQTISLGRLTFGPKVSTSFQTVHGGVISPHLAIKGIWDFDEAETVNLTTGLAAGSDDDLRARVEAGVTARMVNGWTLNGEGFYDGIGADQLSIYGGSVTLTVPLN